jgi:hypothetical protein
MPVAAPTAATITGRETLGLLDGPFRSFAKGVVEDRYALWIGSGISRGRVADLPCVILRVLAFLQEHVTPGVANCRFRSALMEALALANLTAHQIGSIDVDRPIAEWANLDQVVQGLVFNYAKLLNVAVQGEEPDFLLWEGVNVRDVFANPAADPDAEHLCIAILAIEGVASDIASANWDGLIEIATKQLVGDLPILTVCVRGEDLRLQASRSRLFKFHGCAIRAREDEATYRPLLVARHPQIHGWVEQPANAAIVGRLVSIIVGKPTLMVGLSVQDANILNIFNRAAVQLTWNWPGDRPAYVFAENDLGADQQGLLECVYKDAYTAKTRTAIRQSALIQAFAKPLLTALVLYVWCAKLCTLVGIAPSPTLGPAARDQLASGLKKLRDLVATRVEPDHLGFVRTFIKHTGRALALFQQGEASANGCLYRPLSGTPVQQMAAEPALPQSGLRELAVALALFGNGVENGIWSVAPADPADPTTGAFSVLGGSVPAKVFFAANSHAALRLHTNGYVSDDAEDVIVVHSLDVPPTMARSPSGPLGRPGRARARAISVSELLDGPGDAVDLLQRFREEVAL